MCENEEASSGRVTHACELRDRKQIRQHRSGQQLARCTAQSQGSQQHSPLLFFAWKMQLFALARSRAHQACYILASDGAYPIFE